MGELREAVLYDKADGGNVRCSLCAHRCLIAEGKRGICHVRENRGGTLYTLVYGRTIAERPDPIEKKPFHHFQPGSLSYSLATPGCNLKCRWCQNCEISQMPREGQFLAGRESPPERIVREAVASGCRSISYTYTEPTVFFEYALDISRLARAAGLANAFVTNGYMTPAMLQMYHPLLDAATVDLKAFRDETYRKYAGARLEPVLESLRVLKKLGVWIEITTLIIPGINDDPGELREAAGFMASELGPDVPWHLSRFYPAYLLNDVPPTPVATLRRAAEIGREAGLRYVYCGNIADDTVTSCPSCAAELIRRQGYTVVRNRVTPESRCPACGFAIAGLDMGNTA